MLDRKEKYLIKSASISSHLVLAIHAYIHVPELTVTLTKNYMNIVNMVN